MDDDDYDSYIVKGKINEVTKRLASANWAKINSKKALRFLITLSREIVKNDNIEQAQALFQLTNYCCNNLSDLKDTEKDQFLLSLYHVVKYFCKEGLLKNAHTLLEFGEKYCVETDFKSDMYIYYISLFHNHVLQKAQNLEGDVLFTVITYSVKMHMLLKKLDLTQFISRLKLYIQLFSCGNLLESHRKSFMTQILTVLENIPAELNEKDMFEMYKIFLYMFIHSILHVSTSKDENFVNNVQKRYIQICKLLRKRFSDTAYLECTEIFELVTQSIIKSLNKRDKKDVDILIECNKKLQSIIQKRGTNPIVMFSFGMLSKILRTIFEYFQINKNVWNEFFSVSIQTELMKMISILCPFLLKNTESVEKCCKGCNFETDISNAGAISSCGIVFLNVSLKLNIPYTEEMKILTYKVMEMNLKIFNQLREKGCERYLIFWRQIGVGIYNSAVVFYKNKDYKYSKLFSGLFIKNVILLEGVDNPELCFSNSLGCTLHLYAISCEEDKNEYLLYLCLNILLCPNYKKKAFQSWIKLKTCVSEDEENIKTKTLYQILYNEQDAIKEIYPTYEYNAELCENLLMEELQAYCDYWKSKVPLRVLCKDLCEISTNVITRTKCLSLTWEKLYTIDSIFLGYVEDTIKMIDNPDRNPDDTNMKMCLAILYFIQYRCKMNEIYEKNIKDMNEAYIPLKSSPLQPYEEPPNPNDKCDIVPSFYNMKIDNLVNIYEILDQCLDIWKNISNCNEQIDENIASDLNVLHFMKQVAFEFRLQQFGIKMINMWYFYYLICHKLNNKLEIITSIGFIIEYTDTQVKLIKGFMSEAESLIKDLDLTDPVQLEIYLTYYINQSSGYFKNDMMEEGFAALKKAQNYLEEAKNANLKICEARILSLKIGYLLLPCRNQIVKHDENVLITAQNAYSIIGEHYLNSLKTPYLTAVLFEISLSNGWMYKWMCLPREARCYTKDCILLAQKLVIPLQTGNFLCLLAFTDLLDLQYADCEVKLNGLTKMLCYTSNIAYQKMPVPKDQIVKEEEEEISKSSSSEIEDFESVLVIQTPLDIPNSQRSDNFMMNSPDFKKKKFQLPQFMKHPDNCECFMCTNCEYQNLILDTIHLEALLTLYQNIGDLGAKCFQGGYNVWKKIMRKCERYFYVIIQFNKEKVPACLYVQVFQNNFSFLLNYSYFLARVKKFELANRILLKTTNMLSIGKQRNIYLWKELIIQKLNLLEIEQEDMEEKSNKENKLQVPVNTIQINTPENKVSKMNVHLSDSPIGPLKPIKTFKKLKFDLSEDERDDKPKTPETNKNFQFKFQSETSKTPAPNAAKIKIYTPKSVKPKRTTTKVSKPETTSTQSEIKKGFSKQLEERTKLLTEKLKAEKKTTKIENEKPVRNIRKNLLDDLEDVTQSVDKLSLKDDAPKKEIKKPILASSSNKNNKKISTASSSSDISTISSPSKSGEDKKKYRRIKMFSSSSSDSSDSLRKSTRIRNQEKKT